MCCQRKRIVFESVLDLITKIVELNVRFLSRWLKVLSNKVYKIRIRKIWLVEFKTILSHLIIKRVSDYEYMGLWSLIWYWLETVEGHVFWWKSYWLTCGYCVYFCCCLILFMPSFRYMYMISPNPSIEPAAQRYSQFQCFIVIHWTVSFDCFSLNRDFTYKQDEISKQIHQIQWSTTCGYVY